ncbi:type II secretion system protein GspM [sulfur-oxidizing endosymbiont of Gigantopelta aegis]|uniref:type II secretion system protein GspM n=1 Tax=sulfur-oxidizing endosymbiont of Gigantopelta aegis TaxID=2794934 RepID=UPI0018DB44D7|nr:type II secretion system protein M [sulfur-oxidizing endosymbiont of Gigantopelta aegis]
MSELMQKWSALKESERTLIMYGVPVILIAIIYFYIWQPYQKSILDVEQKISYAQEDILWLKQVGVQIQQLKRGVSPVGKFSGSFINIVDKSVKQNRLTKYMKALERSGKDNIILRFEKIDFDQLIKYIAYLKGRYGILIKTIDVQRSDNAKLVNARLVLKKSS